MGHSARWYVWWVCVTVVWLSSSDVSAQVVQLAEANTRQIEALDHEKTVVIIPGGILEQHGPYLPAFTDGYTNEDITDELAEALVAAGRTVLILPQIPLGTGGANEIGKKYVYPGTYAVRSTTLRSVFMDLASELGEQGFRWIFVVHGHGAPNHNRALDQASDFFRDAYGGEMVHLQGIVPSELPRIGRSHEAIEEDGISPHAGMTETSWMLFLRPDLVAEDVRAAPNLTAGSWEEILTIASRPEWPGYFGSPRHATAEYGARHWRALTDWYVDLALRIVDGFDHTELPRRGEMAKRNPVNMEIDRAALEREREIEAKQQAWLARQEG